MKKRNIWILTESFNRQLKKVSFELAAWAGSLADRKELQITALVIGDVRQVEVLGLYGVDSIIHIRSSELNFFNPRIWAKVLFPVIRDKKPDVILGAATTTGKTLLPYLAAKLKTGLTADCTELSLDTNSGVLYQTRPAAGGNIMATIKTVKGSPQMATVRPNSIRITQGNNNPCLDITDIDVSGELSHPDLEFVESIPFDNSTQDIQEAETVVSGGKGLKKGENFRILEDLAALLDAHIGASRDVVDKGWIGYPHQVGLSGKTVTPKLYIAAGISGAIQHIAGMQTSETIVAINNDPDAQIFGISDFGVVTDLFEFLPVFIEHLKNYRRDHEK